MHPTSPTPSSFRGRASLVSVLLVLASTAFAYEGFTVGLSGGVPDGSAYVMNVRAVQPLATATVSGTDLQFSARADVASSLSLDTLPAVGLSAVTSSSAEGVERYLGAGGGVSPSGGMASRPVWSVYGLAGFRLPIASGLTGVIEFQLTSNAVFAGPRLGFALEYTFGGRR